jgi:hypothetical protein
VALKNVVSLIIKGKDEASKHIGKAEKSLTRFQKTTKAFTSFMMGPLGLTAAAAGAAAAIERMVASFAREGDQLAKLSTRLGLTVEFLSEMHFVGERAGVAVNTMDMAMQRATRRIGDFLAGGGQAVEMLTALEQQMGRSITAADDMSTLLPEMATYFANLTDETKAVRQAFSLFDSEGVVMRQVMNQGGEAIRALQKDAHALGVVMGEDDVRAATRFKDASINLNASLRGLRNNAVAPLIDDVTSLSSALAGAVGWLNKAGTMSETAKQTIHGFLAAGSNPAALFFRPGGSAGSTYVPPYQGRGGTSPSGYGAFDVYNPPHPGMPGFPAPTGMADAENMAPGQGYLAGTHGVPTAMKEFANTLPPVTQHMRDLSGATAAARGTVVELGALNSVSAGVNAGFRELTSQTATLGSVMAAAAQSILEALAQEAAAGVMGWITNPIGAAVEIVQGGVGSGTGAWAPHEGGGGPRLP